MWICFGIKIILSFKCFIQQYAGENESVISLLLKYY